MLNWHQQYLYICHQKHHATCQFLLTDVHTSYLILPLFPCHVQLYKHGVPFGECLKREPPIFLCDEQKCSSQHFVMNMQNV